MREIIQTRVNNNPAKANSHGYINKNYYYNNNGLSHTKRNLNYKIFMVDSIINSKYNNVKSLRLCTDIFSITCEQIKDNLYESRFIKYIL